MSTWAWLALAAVACVAYGWSLYRHPWTKCRWPGCKGGRHKDRIWAYAFGVCRGCGGSGRKPRIGVRVLRAMRRSS